MKPELMKSLHNRLTQPLEDFAAMGDTVITRDGPYTHIDRGSSVLAVAHLDWVMYREPTYTKEGIFNCPQLDDRLGAWVILDLLPALGVVPDILLTDSEEVGRSTANYFSTEKQYNWMFEVDRRGEDAVTYQYANPLLEERLELCGWEIGNGSFSDISCLDHLGIQGINFGAGYDLEHSEECHAHWKTIRKNVTKIVRFFKEHENTKMPHEPYVFPHVEDRPCYDPIQHDEDDDEVCVCGSLVNTIYDEMCESCGMPVEVLMKDYYSN